jgi:hypothetical protein
VLTNSLNYLESYGYGMVGTAQFEMAIYDDDIDFDKGWIFKENPQNIIMDNY